MVQYFGVLASETVADCMTGVLYVVSTPIGNLEDISMRALRLLGEVSLIAAEDTRRTRQLLTHFGLHTKLISYHAHSDPERVSIILAELQAGRSVALVCDAGTPLVSDPGLTLVREARASDIRVEAIPGASAVMAAVACSGIAAETFTFLGFLPSKGAERKRALQRVADAEHATVLFESPHRVTRTLMELSAALGEREVVVCRELTKVHEEVRRGSAADLAVQFPAPRGEFTIVIAPADSADRLKPMGAELTAERAYGIFCNMTEIMGRRDAVNELAGRYGLPAREVYRLVEEGKRLSPELSGE